AAVPAWPCPTSGSPAVRITRSLPDLTPLRVPPSWPWLHMPTREERKQPAAGRRAPRTGKASLPFQGPLLPDPGEPDHQQPQEQGHFDQGDDADLVEHHRPREQEGHFQVEQDEDDGDEVIAHIEALAGVLERLETALVGRHFFRIGTPRRKEQADDQKRDADTGGNGNEQK